MAINQGGIRVPIISYFNDKGLKAAQKGLGGLNETAQKLGRTLGVSLGAAAIVSFGKKAATAFAEDQKAAALLANQLRNLGLQDAIGGSEAFIATMQKQTGILDDQLRPAYAQLARVTGSMIKTQDLMKLAFDVSSGSGADFGQTVDALSQAYVGNTKGLKALNIGLTNAELASKSFSDIQAILIKQFGGAGATAAQTYSGQLAIMNAALADATELIGKSLFDALATIQGDAGFGGFIDSVGKAAQAVADLVTGTGRAIRTLSIWLDPTKTFKEKKAEWDKFKIQMGFEDIAAAQQRMGFTQWIPNTAWTPAQKKAEADAIKRAKELLALQKKQNQAAADAIKKAKEKAALDALALKYKQAASIFDEAAIQLQAAMMNKQTDEDYARIKLKQDLMLLQDAINAGDVVTATNLSKIVDEDYKRVQAYQAINIATQIQSGLISNVAAASKLIPTDLNIINIDNLKDALSYIKDLIAQLGKLPTGSMPSGGGGGGGSKKQPVLPTLINPSGTETSRGKVTLPSVNETDMERYLRNLEGANQVIADNAKALQPIVDSGFFDLAYLASEFTGTSLNPYQMTAAQGAAYAASQITVNVAGNVTTEKDLVDAIVAGLNDVTASGVKPFVNRLDPAYL